MDDLGLTFLVHWYDELQSNVRFRDHEGQIPLLFKELQLG